MISVLTAGAVLALAAVRAPTSSQPPSATWRVRRRERQLAAQLPAVLEELARSLRAGLSVSAALRAARGTVGPPAQQDLAEIARALDSGASTAVALEAWSSRRRQVPGVRLAAVALGTAAEAGTAVSQAIDSVADTLRSELAVAAEVRALASQAQASAWLVAVLPVGFGLIASAADPQALSWLVTEPIGRACLVVGLLLDVGALVWMRRIVASIR